LAVKANLIQELPVQNDLVSIILLPLTLAFIMFALGLGLALSDFKRIFTQPRALLVGAVCHFLLLPLACHLMLDWFASVLTIFTLPLIVTWALGHYLGAARAVDVPVGLMMGQVALVMGVPVSLGMLLRQRWPGWAQRFESRATRIATLLFLLIVVLAVLKNFALVRNHIVSLAPFALTLNLGMLAIGFGMAWLARLSRSQAITLGIETAVQNAALALVIASSVLKDDAMAIPGALYGVTMYVGGLLFALTMRRYAPAPACAAAPAMNN
jgi:BASS family bile acid:Na+ symporter